MRRMEKITGRSDDMIILRGVNVFPSQIEEQILKCDALSPHFLLELRRHERMDAMTVVVEARRAAAEDAEREMGAHELAHHVKSVVGVTVGVRVVEPGGVDRSQGKAKRIVDLRPKSDAPSMHAPAVVSRSEATGRSSGT